MTRYNRTVYPIETKLFPDEEQQFPGATLSVDVPRGSPVEGTALNWRLYMEDSPSVSGSIQLEELIKRRC